MDKHARRSRYQMASYIPPTLPWLPRASPSLRYYVLIFTDADCHESHITPPLSWFCFFLFYVTKWIGRIAGSLMELPAVTLVWTRAAARSSRSGKSPGSPRPRRWVASVSTTVRSSKIRRVTAMWTSGPLWRPVGEGSVFRMV